MIIVNPNLHGQKSAELSKKHFPHLFSESGEQTQKTYIYMLFNDIIVESTESAEEIQRKTADFIRHKIKTLSDEIRIKTQTINELKQMI